MDYVDLYLIHWPGSWGKNESYSQAKKRRQDTWRAMELVYESGKAKAIGVSNFMPSHLEDLVETASVKPMVNQFEFNAFQQNESVLLACREFGIVPQGYSPLAKAYNLENSTLLKVAKAKQATPAQILLRWSLQKEVPIIPKTTKPERVKENLGCFNFSLDKFEMELLDSLDSNMHVTWDPTNVV